MKNRLRSHVDALATAVSRLTKSPMTFFYPDYEEDKPYGYRGVILYSNEKCIGCSLCAQICPARALKMYRVPGDKRLRPGYDLGRCIFCGLCTDICPTDALELSSVHDKVFDSLESMVMDPVDWTLWSRKVRGEEMARGRKMRVWIDEDKGLRYEEVR
ncbi:MAG: NADH-quinone oxidoreductase subunit I [Hyperthermus sp.]|nr:MAG: NADH-quinone oxidoreductase subunit I [Hyperthermus sp.]